MIKKKNKRATKKKEQFAKLYVSIGSFLSPYSKSSLLLLLYSMPVFVFVSLTTCVFCLGSSVFLLSYCVPTPVSHSKSFTILLSYCVPALFSCSRSSIVLLSCFIPDLTAFAAFFLLCHTFVSCCRFSALLLPLSVFGLSFFLVSSLFKIFK